jgi:hypothetical protein
MEKVVAIIIFDDPDCQMESFTDLKVAQERFEQVKTNWNCDLFVSLTASLGKTEVDVKVSMNDSKLASEIAKSINDSIKAVHLKTKMAIASAVAQAELAKQQG